MCVSIFLSNRIDYITPKGNFKAHYGLWIIIAHQCRFTLNLKKKKSIILVDEADNRDVVEHRGYEWV